VGGIFEAEVGMKKHGGEEGLESAPKEVWQRDLIPPGITTAITLGFGPCVF
jgi:hypothetical protein